MNNFHKIFLLIGGFIITISATISIIFPYANNRLIKAQSANTQKLILSTNYQDIELSAMQSRFNVIIQNQGRIMADMDIIRKYLAEHEKQDAKHSEQDNINFKEIKDKLK